MSCSGKKGSRERRQARAAALGEGQSPLPASESHGAAAAAGGATQAKEAAKAQRENPLVEFVRNACFLAKVASLDSRNPHLVTLLSSSF